MDEDRPLADRVRSFGQKGSSKKNFLEKIVSRGTKWKLQGKMAWH